MKMLVLGSGVIGVTTAYYLAKAGHEVMVLDRREGPALETSYANAGEISPGYSTPWAAPGIPVKAMKWLLMKHSPLIIGPKPDWDKLMWTAMMLRNCTEARYAINKNRMLRLSEYSRDKLLSLRDDTGIAFDERMQGTLQLFRTPAQLDGIAKDIAILQADGVPFEVLDQDGCIAAEPGLAASRHRFVGGLRLPNDGTGDCYLFTTALAKHTEALGVRYRYGADIRRFVVAEGRVTGVETDRGLESADGFVLALGSHSPELAGPLGIRLPIYPVKGYSITVPIKAGMAERAPASTVMDESYKIAITRLGGRIRVGGMAELNGFNPALRARPRETLHMSLNSLFPGVAEEADDQYWAGFRPMTPDGTPAVGATRYANLWTNSGHGTLGWTMACGSAAVVANLVSGRPTEIESADLSAARYNR